MGFVVKEKWAPSQQVGFAVKSGPQTNRRTLKGLGPMAPN
jgi:hypothetical protein